MTITNNIFNEIKSSLSNKTDSSYKDIMKFEPGKTYVVRLVPNINEPKSTIYHYYHHSWNSLATGQFVTALCPTTYGESCPIDSYVLKTYNNGTTEEREKIRPITRKENWMVNAFVISDPTNPENEGKVKVIRYGKELAKIISNAIDGDDADEFGVKIFDVVNGCSLKIKCESRTGSVGSRAFVSYTSSKFMGPSKLEDIDSKKLDEIHNSIFELDKFTKPKSQADLQRLLDQHFFCTQDIVEEEKTSEEKVLSKKAPLNDNDDKLNEIFAGIKSVSDTPSVPKEATPPTDDTDAKLKELLANL
jgi:hypothetical protein